MYDLRTFKYIFDILRLECPFLKDLDFQDTDIRHSVGEQKKLDYRSSQQTSNKIRIASSTRLDRLDPPITYISLRTKKALPVQVDMAVHTTDVEVRRNRALKTGSVMRYEEDECG